MISRGELVEIGGGFRVPDVMRQSGAVLREVGTTNRTRVNDYVAAVSARDRDAAARAPVQLPHRGLHGAAVARATSSPRRERCSVPVVEDIGSGCLVDDLAGEPSVQASIAAGADLVCFSGDKLLGGPQAGIIAGRAALVDRLRTHPLMRALRVDKITLADARGDARRIRRPAAPTTTVPVQRMLHLSPDDIEARAAGAGRDARRHGWRVAMISGSSAVGGGSAPGLELPTVLLSIERDGIRRRRLEAMAAAARPAGHRAHRARPRRPGSCGPCCPIKTTARTLLHATP